MTNIKKSFLASAKKMARPAPQKRMIRKVVYQMSETKKHSVEADEQNLSALNSPQSANLHLLDLIPAGTTYASRIGHKIRAQGISLRGHVHCDAGQVQYVKMAVIRVKDQSVNFLTAGLETNNGNISPVGKMKTIWQRINTDAFEVLATRVMKVGLPGSGADNATKMFKLWIPFKRSVCFDGTSAAAPKYNQVFVCFWSADSKDDTTGGDTCSYSFQSTYYFKDL